MPVSALAAAISAASLNLCADEYLLLLGRPDEIASVSYLSQDRRESPLWRSARRHSANRGSIEQIVRYRPDLLFTMGGTGKATALVARKLGIRAVDLKPNSGIADVEANLLLVAEALGDRSRAVPWIGAIRRFKKDKPRGTADAIWVSGHGATLAADSIGAQWLRLAGLRQRAVRGGRASLENILTNPPQVLVISQYRSGQTSRGLAWLEHPIIGSAPSKKLTADGRRWTCMGPLMIEEIRRLKAELK